MTLYFILLILLILNGSILLGLANKHYEMRAREEKLIRILSSRRFRGRR